MKRKFARWSPARHSRKTPGCARMKPASTCSWKSANLNMPDALTNDPNFAEAFIAHEREQRIYTGKIACLLVVFLMPVGFCLDYFVYPQRLDFFLVLRLI